MIPLSQVVSGVEVDWEDPVVMRRDRIPTITVHADPRSVLPSHLFNRVRQKIEQIKLPPGYSLEWGGEYEDSREARAALAKPLPGSAGADGVHRRVSVQFHPLHAGDLPGCAVGDYRRNGGTSDYQTTVRLHGSTGSDRLGRRADQELDRLSGRDLHAARARGRSHIQRSWTRA